VVDYDLADGFCVRPRLDTDATSSASAIVT
jgi:hypothetical protein